MGIILVQWCTSVAFGMGVAYAAKMGMNVKEVALFMDVIMGGVSVLHPEEKELV